MKSFWKEFRKGLFTKSQFLTGVTITLLTTSAVVYAFNQLALNIFAPATTISAAQVNANFEYLKERFSYFYGVNHGFNFMHRFYFIVKYKKGFEVFKIMIFFFNSHIQRIKNPSVSKISLFPSYFFSFIANFITFIFLTEPITNELEGLFRGEDFKKVLHGENIKMAYESKLYEKSLDKIAEDLENR